MYDHDPLFDEYDDEYEYDEEMEAAIEAANDEEFVRQLAYEASLADELPW